MESIEEIVDRLFEGRHTIQARKKIRKRVPQFTVFMIMILSVFTVMFVIFPNDTIVSAATTDFDNWIKINIESDQIDSTLTNFPVLISNTSCTILSGLDSNDFTFFNSDNTTEATWELETWDDTNDDLYAWVLVSSLSHTTDTTIYLYYDDTAAGSDGGENNPTGVWDSDFQAVYHLNEQSGTSVDDSTSNNNDGTSSGVTVGANGQIFDCYSFDGTADYIDCGFNIASNTDFTVTMWALTDNAATDNQRLACQDRVGAAGQWIFILDDVNGWSFRTRDSGNSSWDSADKGSSPSDSTWYYVTGITNLNDNNYVYENSSQLDSVSVGASVNPSPLNIFIGGDSQGGDEQNYVGDIDEFRISTIQRSQDWLETEYNNMINKTTFVVFGQSGTVGGGGTPEQCYYNVTGYDGSNRITFGSGTTGTRLWSNATGNWDAGAMLIINVSTNTTVGVEDIIIDLNNTDLGGNIHWENISIDVAYHTTSATSANTSFPNDDYAVIDIDDGLGNVSLNASWDLDWANPNPFPLSNDTLGADHFFCIRFMVELPSDATTGGPYMTDNWAVKWKTTGE